MKTDLQENINGAGGPLTRASVEKLLGELNSAEQLSLSCQDLRGIDLGGTDLKKVDLRLANLTGATLRQINLFKANLSGADLRGADLRGADLRGANLSKANLSRTDLSEADLSEANLSGARLAGAICSGARLGRIQRLRARLKGARLAPSDPTAKRENAYTSRAENAVIGVGATEAAKETAVRSLSGTASVPSRSERANRLAALLPALHPRRWSKSLFVCVALLTDQRAWTPSSLGRVLLALAIFALASSCIYMLNDLFDLRKDREHPVKRMRPLASGALPIPWAIASLAFLFSLCVFLTFLLFTIPVGPTLGSPTPLGGPNVLFVLITCLFLLLTILYTLRLKHVVLVDVFTTAGSAVLRLLAGAVVIPVALSPWLSLLTMLLVLFFGLGKRRHELGLLQGHADRQRPVLKEYSIPLLDQAMTVLVTAFITVYSLYTFLGNAGHQLLVLTIPLALYGMLRYLYLVSSHMEGSDPEGVVFHDWHLLVTVISCAAIFIVSRFVLI